jgi:hypothetical protein
MVKRDRLKICWLRPTGVQNENKSPSLHRTFTKCKI